MRTLGVLAVLSVSILFGQNCGYCESLSGTMYYSGNSQEIKNVEIPMVSEGVYRLFDHTIAYRDDMKPYLTFELPNSQEIISAKVEIKAYNDDATYLRDIWFEIDGIGGSIGTYRLDLDGAKEEWKMAGRVAEGTDFKSWTNGQVRGDGVIGQKQTKSWSYNLNLVKLSTTGENGETKEVNLFDVLKKPGKHTISCWVATYRQYGPESWVTVDLIIERQPSEKWLKIDPVN